MKYIFIVNPAAGNGDTIRILPRLENRLKEKNIDYEIVMTDRPLHASEIAEQYSSDPQATTVVAVGGDGTAYETACGILSSDTGMGIIPAGTGNDFIKSLNIPKDPEQALDVLITKRAEKVDVGKINDRIFLNVCGTGFDVTVLDYAEKLKKRYKGLVPYLLGLIKAVAYYKPVHVYLEIDGKAVEKDLLVCSVANGRYIGGGIPICPDADITDGKLDVVMVQNVNRWKIPFYLPGLLSGKVLKWKISTRIKSEHVIMRSRNMRLNVDGQILQTEEAEFTVKPLGMRIVH